MNKRGAFERRMLKVPVPAAESTASDTDASTHIQSGFNTRDKKDDKIVCIQSDDGHGVSSVALRLSASKPKADRAMQSCVTRSENAAREGDEDNGERTPACREGIRTMLSEKTSDITLWALKLTWSQ